ncbi:MAG: histidine kinase [Rhodoferax sp.]
MDKAKRLGRTGVWMLGVAMALLGVLGGCAPVPVDTPSPVHLQQAQAWASPSARWEPPDSLSDGDDAVQGEALTWKTVDLPHAQPRQLAGAPVPADQSPQVLWYRMTLPAAALAATPQGPRLYVPRWQTIGTVAVYVDGRLVWETRGSRVWNGFNRPLWIDLGGAVHPGADATVHLRMAMLPGVGGALSTVWVGPAEQLRASWRVRNLLQADLIALMGGAYMVLGVFALLVWLARRRSGEAAFLMFFLMSVCHSLSSLHFLVKIEGFAVQDDWFSWLTLAGTHGSLLCSFYFLCLVQQHARPRLGRAMAAYVLVMALLALPVWGVSLNSMLPLLRLSTLPSLLLVLVVALGGAWRQRTVSSVLLAAWILLSVPMGLADLALQNYRANIENIYLTPYFYLGMFTLFLAIALTRYTGALEVAARANATLAERLAAQERDLVETHARLREAERAQTLLHERQRLMREMHDGVGSSLISALFLVESQRSAELDVAQVLRECIDDLKLALDSMEPVDADLVALLGSLRFRLGPRLEGAGLTLRWAVEDLPPLPWLDAQSALHVLRILQEVLTNIIKHNSAHQITLRTGQAAWEGQPGVQVMVQDDGQPFAPAPVHQRQPARKGLNNVLVRADALGGHVQWQAQPEGGTLFTLWLPLHAAASRASM